MTGFNTSWQNDRAVIRSQFFLLTVHEFRSTGKTSTLAWQWHTHTNTTHTVVWMTCLCLSGTNWTPVSFQASAQLPQWRRTFVTGTALLVHPITAPSQRYLTHPSGVTGSPVVTTPRLEIYTCVSAPNGSSSELLSSPFSPWGINTVENSPVQCLMTKTVATGSPAYWTINRALCWSSHRFCSGCVKKINFKAESKIQQEFKDVQRKQILRNENLQRKEEMCSSCTLPGGQGTLCNFSTIK